jgi:hypothetical protein
MAMVNGLDAIEEYVATSMPLAKCSLGSAVYDKNLIN